jgi:hypothetical protein
LVDDIWHRSAPHTSGENRIVRQQQWARFFVGPTAQRTSTISSLDRTIDGDVPDVEVDLRPSQRIDLTRPRPDTDKLTQKALGVAVVHRADLTRT